MNNSSANSHHRVERSTTLNRKYVKRPTPKIRSTAEIHAENLRRRQALAERMNRERLLKLKSKPTPTQVPAKKIVKAPVEPLEKPKKHPVEISVRNRLKKAQSIQKEKTISLKERKEQAISAAIKSMTSEKPEERKKLHKSFLSFKRVALALSCTILVISAAVYFINLSMPNLSVSVAAMKAGLDATYPSYTPKGFFLSSTNSENGRLTLVFKSSTDEYTVTEEKSSWNSSALESNYIKPVYGKNYSTIREQGLTLYISESNCVWVNGGKLLTITSNFLTKSQLTSLATSL